MIPDKPMRRPAGLGQPVIWSLCGFVLATLSWSFVGTLDVVTTARGRVVSEGLIKSVQSAVSSTVAAIHIKEGDTVKPGDVLIELDDTMFQADVAAVSEKIAQLESELSRLEAESKDRTIFPLRANLAGEARNAAQRAVQATRQASIRQREQEQRATIDARRASLASGESTLAVQEARLGIAKEKERRALPYVDIAVPRFQYLQLKDDVLALERDIAAQRLTNVRLAEEIQEARYRLLQVASAQKEEVAREISDKRSTLTQLNAELNKTQKRVFETRIRAPQGGTVQKVMVTTVGANVGPGDVLLQIVPAGARLIVEVLIPNEEKGYLQAGQPVDVKLDAFPFQKHGRLEGQLEWISPDAELSTNANVSLLTAPAQARALTTSIPQYVYRGHVIVRPESNPAVWLTPGLTAQVDIYTDRRRIIDFFLFPLRQATDDAFRVR